ncbi:polysaccharide biosynthesis/export family protein [Pseudogemmobacter bohemicus]|uniref:polysaccharide biosynthesis/export family protein n=1 Tax=Pseudogemmobacter bohemicus TaxID=2250708 RepID=UPI000DD2DBC3|nr:polysaccharide biosynthesis/export family protein [Pseudogemmobacter bohemicus]
MKIWIAVLLALVSLAACDVTRTDFPVRTEAVRTEVEELATNVAIVKLSADNIEAFNKPRNLGGSRTTMPSGDGWDYKVGVGDVLDIVVWDYPELTMPAGEGRTPQESGLRVQADGTFFYPHVGQIQARGRNPEQIRSDLTRRLGEFIPNPQIEVRVVSYKSQAISVTGEVSKPSRQALTDVALTLLDAIDAAGGLTAEADARAVLVRRQGRSFTVDLEAFLENGVGANNPTLRAGDVVSVPRRGLQEAYLLGQIVKPSTVDLTRENVTLTQALTRVGGLREESADARGIFVFRDTPMGITVYQLDASNPAAYLIGTRFILHPQDVIYVTSAPLHRWNRVISSLLPTLATVRAADSISTN